MKLDVAVDKDDNIGSGSERSGVPSRRWPRPDAGLVDYDDLVGRRLASLDGRDTALECRQSIGRRDNDR